MRSFRLSAALAALAVATPAFAQGVRVTKDAPAPARPKSGAPKPGAPATKPAAGSASDAVDEAAALKSLIDADHAFSARANSDGYQASLLGNLSDDAVLFAPRPITGRVWAASGAPPTGKFSWEPSWAVVARSGELAVTSGPVAYAPGTPAAPGDTSSTGQYVTVWSKITGSWKAVLSMTAPGPQAATAAFGTHRAAGDGRPRSGPGAADASRATLFIADRGLAAAAMGGGAATAVTRVVLPDVRVVRRGLLPAVGPDSARAALAATDDANGAHTVWQTLDVRMARSADFGVAYGNFDRRDATGAIIAQGGYVRVWERQPDGGWRIVLDAEN